MDTLTRHAEVTGRHGSAADAIAWWLSAVSAVNQPVASKAGLQAVYRSHTPVQGEIVFTGACAYACRHCIYPPSFAASNKNLSADDWNVIFGKLHDELGISTFVYGGRSVSKPGIRALASLREALPGARIGLIDNAISYVPFKEQIVDLGLDWIDISVDGLEREHDEQRGVIGGFKETLKGLDWLVSKQAAPKINVLSCLTTINRHSLIPMIRELSERGLPNFFITPVSLLDGVRPDPSLRVSSEEFASFVFELEDALSSMDDVWVEMLMFGADYFSDLLGRRAGLAERFTPSGDSLVLQSSSAGRGAGVTNELYLRYFPISLNGVREFIVNTNGDFIFPKVAAYGQIPEHGVAGNLLHDSPAELYRDLPSLKQFDFYVDEFLKEQQMLGRFFKELS